MDDENAPQETFLSHLIELRDRLIRCLVVVGIAFIPTFIYGGELYDLLKTGTATPEQLVRLVAGSGPHEIELLETRPVEFRCRCDLRRIEAMVSGLPLRDLDEMIVEGKAEITCNFCASVYTLSVETLLQARAEHPDAGKGAN